MTSNRVWAVAAGMTGATGLGVYLVLILSEQNNGFVEVSPWAAAMLLGVGLAFVGATAKSPRLARPSLLGAAIVFGLIGMAAIFSIGLLFVAAAVLSAVAYAKPPRESQREGEEARSDA